VLQGTPLKHFTFTAIGNEFELEAV
jgi:hypothetical protein